MQWDVASGGAFQRCRRGLESSLLRKQGLQAEWPVAHMPWCRLGHDLSTRGSRALLLTLISLIWWVLLLLHSGCADIDVCKVFTFLNSKDLTQYSVSDNATLKEYCWSISGEITLECQTDYSSGPPYGFTCECPKGYQWNEDHTDCVDQNECNEYKCAGLITNLPAVYDEELGFYTSVHPAYQAICVNLPGTYNCTCPPCYYPSQFQPDTGIPTTCDPLPGCQLTTSVQLQPFYINETTGVGYSTADNSPLDWAFPYAF